METLSVTQNGTYTPTSPNIGFSQVTVNVSSSQPSGTLQQTISSNGVTRINVANYEFIEVTVAVPLQTKTISTNGTHNPDAGYAGFSQVTIDVPNGVQGLQATQNGTYRPTSPNIGFDEVTVAVPASEVDSGTLQTPINTNGTQTINVVGYAGHEITVNVPNGVQGLNATQNGTYRPTSPNIGFDEVTVNVPASEVDTGTKQTTIATNGTQTVDVIGYAGHEVTVNVPASAVDSGTKQVSKTQNGTTTENVVGYANVEITVNVPAPYWSGTQTQYDNLGSYSNDMLYLIIN